MGEPDLFGKDFPLIFYLFFYLCFCLLFYIFIPKRNLPPIFGTQKNLLPLAAQFAEFSTSWNRFANSVDGLGFQGEDPMFQGPRVNIFPGTDFDVRGFPGVSWITGNPSRESIDFDGSVLCFLQAHSLSRAAPVHVPNSLLDWKSAGAASYFETGESVECRQLEVIQGLKGQWSRFVPIPRYW